jgi:hypothetical protein
MPDTSDVTRPIRPPLPIPDNVQEATRTSEELRAALSTIEAQVSMLHLRIIKLEETVNHNDPPNSRPSKGIAAVLSFCLGTHPTKLLHLLFQDSAWLIVGTITILVVASVLKYLFAIGEDVVIHVGSFPLSLHEATVHFDIFAMCSAMLAFAARWIRFLWVWVRGGTYDGVGLRQFIALHISQTWYAHPCTICRLLRWLTS